MIRIKPSQKFTGKYGISHTRPNLRQFSLGYRDALGKDTSHDVTGDDYTPVVITGGGPTGLMLSSLLSRYAIPSKVYEAKSFDQLCRHPQAHFLNTRTMELLKRYLSSSFWNKLLKNMPPLNHWEHFYFGYSVCSGRRLGYIHHPMHRNVEELQVSDCYVGHLAQNNFTQLLLEEANENIKRLDHKDATKGSFGIHLNTRVIRIEDLMKNESDNYGKDRGRYAVYTTNSETGEKLRTRCNVIVAADGAHSFVRSNYCTSKEKCIDVPHMEEQHLINIHFSTSPALTKHVLDQYRQKEDDKSYPGMLHFCYNEHVVCAFVLHDMQGKGSWVCQIPYFPPFQTFEDDFGRDQSMAKVWAGLGIQNGSFKPDDITLHEIRPWIMKCDIAPNYVIHEGIVLAGDAAHVFPPAGGFGMNTGIQDAHNLAWRLALNLHDPSLHKYHEERRPVAVQNAALSVRNYHRTLGVAKGLGLDAAHPALLKQFMNSPPIGLLPLNLRQEAFRTLMKTALTPLAALSVSKGGLVSNIMANNVADILRRGEGLPLLFPRYELGFTYGQGSLYGHDRVAKSASENTSLHEDTADYMPQLRIGHRLPHIVMKIMCSDNQSEALQVEESEITLLDLPISLASPGQAPNFVLLVNSPDRLCLAIEAAKEILSCLGIFVKVVEICNSNTSRNASKSLQPGLITLQTQDNKWKDLLVQNQNSDTHNFSNTVVLVRPDGHVGDIQHLDKSTTVRQFTKLIMIRIEEII